jgi:5,5'-dehydrodivanillate O-demethylase oxygenase subunit
VATAEENALFTRVGPGTRMGDLMRRYWHPISTTHDLDQDPVRPVRLLGEDLVLYRDAAGKLGLIGARCAHRGISMAYGIPQENGLRCAYHGWTYNQQGQVVDMPFEPACLPLKIPAYPVQELAGTVWAYLGPEPAPLLPRWDVLIRERMERSIRITELPCNWLQCMDNSLDPVHFEHLHGTYGNFMMRRLGLPKMMHPARHVKIGFDPWIYGMYKRRLTEGQSEEAGDWTVGHPIIFPHCLAQGDSLQYRVPIDDTHTLHFTFWAIPTAKESWDESWLVEHAPLAYDHAGRVLGDYVIRQDEMAWIGQGPITDRATEHLATSDKGIMLYRRLLRENMDLVAKGEDPIAVIRDPAVNEPMIEIERGSTYDAFRAGIPMENRGGARPNQPVRA